MPLFLNIGSGNLCNFLFGLQPEVEIPVLVVLYVWADTVFNVSCYHG